MCPVCERGEIVDRVCTRCGVAVPRTVDTWPAFHWTHGRPPVDRINPYTDYARTKDDKR